MKFKRFLKKQKEELKYKEIIYDKDQEIKNLSNEVLFLS